MTAQHDSNSGANAERGQGAVAPSAPVPARRRILVRGAAAALPTILTLHSGAALARSSNLISAMKGFDATGPNRCIALADVKRADGTPADGTLADGKYDLGEPPVARVTEFTKGNRYATGEDRSNPVTPLEICSNPNVDYYVSTDGTNWTKVPTIEKGFLVSATAWSSFSLNPTRVI